MTQLERARDQIVDDWFHYTSGGSHSTRLKDLYDWAKREFGIEPGEWTVVRGRKIES